MWKKSSEDVMHWLWFLVVGVLAGWLSGKLTRGRGFGQIGDLVVGPLGALVGGFLARLHGVVSVGVIGSLVSATAGAIVLLRLIRSL
jgi:uncharacterized membrane protein YeaQ/YmgE (transglycosylase-associated protein family)